MTIPLKKENRKMKEDSSKDDVDKKPTMEKGPLELATGVESARFDSSSNSSGPFLP
jgi:hypothetical protein